MRAGWSVLLGSAPRAVLPFWEYCLWMTQSLLQYSPMDLECKVEFDPHGLVITGKDILHKIFS